MRVPRSVVSVVLLLGLAGAALAQLAGLGHAAGPVQAAQAAQAESSACEFPVNGSFESPLVPTGSTRSVTPSGWSGTAVIRNGSVVELVDGSYVDRRPTAGAQFVTGITGTLSLAIPTGGMGGQTLTASFNLKTYAESTVVRLGDSVGEFATYDHLSSSRRFSLTYVLPINAPTTTTLSFSLGSDPRSEDLALDNVSVTFCTNSPPLLTSETTGLLTLEDTPVTGRFTVSDRDTPPGNLTLTATGPGGSRVTFGGSGSDRTLTYTPAPNANGSESFTVGVSDGFSTDTDLWRVDIAPVNDAPTAVDDALAPSDENETRTIRFSDLTRNDSRGPANEAGQSRSSTTRSSSRRPRATAVRPPSPTSSPTAARRTRPPSTRARSASTSRR